MRKRFLKQITPTNSKKLYSLLKESLIDGILGFRSEENITGFLKGLRNDMLQGRTYLYVIEYDRKYIAMTIIKTNDLDTQKHIAEISKTIISMKSRGHKILLLGLKDIIEFLYANGIEILKLDIREEHKAIAVWKHLGFKVYGSLKYYSYFEGKYYDGVYMYAIVKDINPNKLFFKRNYSDETLAIRKSEKINGTDSNCEQLVLTSSYRFDSPEDAMNKFTNKKEGHIYSRISNPTTSALEERVSCLEKGKFGIVYSSGMSAIYALFQAVLDINDHMICCCCVFGSTIKLVKEHLIDKGIKVDFIETKEFKNIRNYIKPNTKLVFFETPTNPTLEIIDIKKTTQNCKNISKDIIIAVDNTLSTPISTNPILLGADVVLHSAAKYLDGQGRVMGGIIVTSNESIMIILRRNLRIQGNCISPFNAWLILKSVETLKIRYEKHCENALKVAQYMNNEDFFLKVNYPGLKTHPQNKISLIQQNNLHGGVISFELKSKECCWHFVENLNLITLSTNIGDTKTLITHPYSTTHCNLLEEEKQRYGILDNLLRLSIGLEFVEDIIYDIKQSINTYGNTFNKKRI